VVLLERRRSFTTEPRGIILRLDPTVTLEGLGRYWEGLDLWDRDTRVWMINPSVFFKGRVEYQKAHLTRCQELGGRNTWGESSASTLDHKIPPISTPRF